MLMTTAKDDLLNVRQDMSKKIPEPLTNQFTERRSGQAAIKKPNGEKEQRSATLT